MKRIEIIIPDRWLGDVNNILKEANTGGMSYYKIEGRGRVKAKPVAIDRGTRQYTPEYVPRLKIEVVVKDEQAEDIIDRIVSKIGNPKLGGKIFVVDIPVAIDLATKKRGDMAL